jgi:hypothetical protein
MEIDELPALRVIRVAGGELDGLAAAYTGGFRFGAFDQITEWLDDQGLVAYDLDDSTEPPPQDGERGSENAAAAPDEPPTTAAAAAAASAPPVAASSWPQCTALESRALEEEFLQQSQSATPKAIFFSSLGKSALCEKLAAAFAGRVSLDFAVVPKSVELQRLTTTEYPALQLITPASGRSAAAPLEYVGGFKFGAFDAISEWLEESLL